MLRSLALASAALLLASQAHAGPGDDVTHLTLDRVFADPPLEGRVPQGLAISPGGTRLTYLVPSPDDSDVLDLWSAPLDGTPAHLLVSTRALLDGKAQKLTEAERMALERKRISKRGITSSFWCGDDDKTLMFPLSGALYEATLSDGTPHTRALLHDDGAPPMDASCSPHGQYVSFVKGGNVVVLDRKTGTQRALTHEATATHTFGLAEFVAQEEMGRSTGLWWSPDERTVLMFDVDESGVSIKVRPQIFADHTELVQQRYPAAGEKNAVVKAWLVDVKSGKRTAIALPHEDGYLARGGFSSSGNAWVQWQSRDQKTLTLLGVDAHGKTRTLLTEHDDAWVELHDDLHALKDGRLLWSSERSGRRQLELVDPQTGARTALTSEPEPVQKVMALDDRQVWFTRFGDRGRTLALYTVPLAGGTSSRITPDGGWHEVTCDPHGRTCLDKRSDFGTPPTVHVLDGAGHERFTIDGTPGTPLELKAQFVDVTADDGTLLNAVLLPPRDLATAAKGARFPVIVYTYGGPTAQTVTHRWHKTQPLFSYWTQHGYGVFLVDNRGMGGRDRSFTRAMHHHFGDVEVRDLFAGVQTLKQTAWVDPARIGVFGWSYGGTNSLRAVLDDNTPFAAAASVAPVTDWSLYDTHYTERYLGLPTDGDLYKSTALAARASLLHTPLLLVHGTADDNVLFEHSLRMVTALQDAGKPFELMIYPGKAHGISGKKSQHHVYETITAFFDRTIGAGARMTTSTASSATCSEKMESAPHMSKAKP
jgi:dipeptidyl-peptidase-4